MADRPKAPSKPKEVKAPDMSGYVSTRVPPVELHNTEEVPPIVPPTEIVLSMAPCMFTREQVIELVSQVVAATNKGLVVRFA
jgi:hypothetical protein